VADPPNITDIRPSSETGARPKTSSLVSSANAVNSSSGGSKQAPLVVNGENKINNEVKNENDDHEEIRQRRLAVFEEQKRRLMKKN